MDSICEQVTQILCLDKPWRPSWLNTWSKHCLQNSHFRVCCVSALQRKFFSLLADTCLLPHRRQAGVERVSGFCELLKTASAPPWGDGGSRLASISCRQPRLQRQEEWLSWGDCSMEKTSVFAVIREAKILVSWCRDTQVPLDEPIETGSQKSVLLSVQDADKCYQLIGQWMHQSVGCKSKAWQS